MLLEYHIVSPVGTVTSVKFYWYIPYFLLDVYYELLVIIIIMASIMFNYYYYKTNLRKSSL